MKRLQDLRISIIGMGRLMETIRPCYAALSETPERLAVQVVATTLDERGLKEKNERLGFPVLLGQNDEMLRTHKPDLILFAPPPHDALSLTESVLAPYAAYCLQSGIPLPTVFAFPPSPGPEQYAARLPETMQTAVVVPCLGADGGFVLASVLHGLQENETRSLIERFFRPMASVLFMESSGIPAYLGSACMYPIAGNLCSDISRFCGWDESVIGPVLEGWKKGIADFRSAAGIDVGEEEIRQQTANYIRTAKTGGESAVIRMNIADCTPGGIAECVLMSYNAGTRSKLFSFLTELRGEPLAAALFRLARNESNRLSAIASERAAALHLPLSDEAAFTDDRKQAFRDCLLQAAGSAGVDLPHELEDDLAAIDGQTPNTFYRACSKCLFRQLSFADADLLLWLARIAYGARFGQGAAFRMIYA